MYSVCDGHGGATCAQFVASHLYPNVVKEACLSPAELATNMLKVAFEHTEASLKRRDKTELRGGSTCVLAWIRALEQQLHVAWLGDSNALLLSQDGDRLLTIPHNVDNKDELERISNAGGFTVFSGGILRVQGQVSITRAFGDFNLKPPLSSEPDVVSVDLSAGRADCLVLGSDGLWDGLSSEEIADYIREFVVSSNNEVDAACERGEVEGNLAKHLIAEAKQGGSCDNISIVVVFLRPFQCVRTEWERAAAGNSGSACNNRCSVTATVDYACV
jgi:serine/threonine protein phosphatase PrpC